MSTADKILAKMRRNPRDDWRIEHLFTVANRLGIAFRRPEGSHVIFFHPASEIAASVPDHKPIKAPYIRLFLRLVDDVLEDKS